MSHAAENRKGIYSPVPKESDRLQHVQDGHLPTEFLSSAMSMEIKTAKESLELQSHLSSYLFTPTAPNWKGH